MRNTIVYLIGHQGVGKRTIGSAICGATGAVLVDSHLIANPIFSVVSIDRVAKVPAAVKRKVSAVRSAVLAAMVEDASVGQSFVLTDVLFENATGAGRYGDVVDAAGARGAVFVPVLLYCADDVEYARRVTDPPRAAHLKQTDLAISLKRRATEALLRIDHPNLLVLEVGPLPASSAAAAIIRHAEAMGPAT
jgi:hypothetical protein